MMKMLQQGDVTMEKVEGIPATAKRVSSDNGRLVLRDGEVTGHAHRVIESPGVELYEDEHGTLWMVTEKPVDVTHEEHKTVTVPPGKWQIGGVREWDYLQEMEREIVD